MEVNIDHPNAKREAEAVEETIDVPYVLSEIKQSFTLFHDENNKTYCLVNKNNVKHAFNINSADFTDYIEFLLFDHYDLIIGKKELNNFVKRLNIEAKFKGERTTVFKRVGFYNNKMILDLCNNPPQFIEISKNGWQIITEPPIKFLKTHSMKPLPAPRSEGTLDELFNFIRVPKESQLLVLAWILECLRLNTAYPILCLHGAQGSAKSTNQWFLKELLDPSNSNLRSSPQKLEDLAVAAENNHLITYNNLSSFTAKQQDMLCKMSTGGVFATRKFHKNDEEVVLEIKRPLILNGIHEVIEAQDLIDRCLFINLYPIPPSERKTDTDIHREFYARRAYLLGAILNLLSNVLKEIPKIKKENLPRMADFAVLGMAVEKALKAQKGSFIEAYSKTQSEMKLVGIDKHPIIESLIDYIRHHKHYCGTYKKLYTELTKIYKEKIYGEWPKSVEKFSHLLKRQQMALKHVNIEMDISLPRIIEGKVIKLSFHNSSKNDNIKKNL